MKSLPLWKGLIEDKAILIAAFAESIYRVAFPQTPLTKYLPAVSASGEYSSDRKKALCLPKLQPGAFGNLHLASKVFVVAEVLDLLTTMVGLLVIPGIWEANPIVGFIGGWFQTVILKSTVVILVVSVVELMRRPLKVGKITVFSGRLSKAIWIIPFVAALPVLWNNLVIILELIA